MRLLRRSVALALFLILMLPAFALAVGSARALVLPTTQLWTLVIGSLVPLVTYVLNHVGPWLSEPVKAAVLVVVSAVVTALYAALSTSVFGWNDATLQLVLSGVLAALAAHHLLWKPSLISSILGGGSNRQEAGRPVPVRRRRKASAP